MAFWYSSMNVPQRRTFWACLMGWALDAMDVQLFAFVIPTLIAVWGLTKSEAGMIGTAALVTSAIGGVLAGLLADRIGRVRVLQITIVWFALFTGLSALTNNFHQLLITRSLQGLGFGGEWAAGAVLIGEAVDKHIRGRAVGTVQSGWPIGYGMAALSFPGRLVACLVGDLGTPQCARIGSLQRHCQCARQDHHGGQFCSDFFPSGDRQDHHRIAARRRCTGW